jgi:hypothetical protein
MALQHPDGTVLCSDASCVLLFIGFGYKWFSYVAVSLNNILVHLNVLGVFVYVGGIERIDSQTHYFLSSRKLHGE